MVFCVKSTQLIVYMFGYLYLDVGKHLQQLLYNKINHLAITSQYSVALHCDRECIYLETHLHVTRVI